MTQPVTLTHLPVNYVSSIPPEQFLGQPGEQDLGQLLATQPSEPHPDSVVSQASEVCSLPSLDVLELLNSSHSSLAPPKTPTLSPCPKRKGGPPTKELAKERPAVEDSPDSPPEDTYPPERGQKKAGGASRNTRRSSPVCSLRREERA